MGWYTKTSLKRLSNVDTLNSFYDLEIDDIQRAKDSLILNSNKGKFQLIPTTQDEDFLLFLFSAHQHLQEKGFTNFRVIHPTKDKKPFIKIQQNLFVLVREAHGDQFTYNSENIKKAMEELAAFHNAARGLTPIPGSEFEVSWGKWPDKCFNEINDVVERKLAFKAKRLTGFDEKFLQHADYLIERGLMAWERFNHNDYRHVLKEEMDAKAFNLHSYRSSKLNLMDDQVFINDLNDIRYEIQFYDLVDFIDELLLETDFSAEEVADFVKHYLSVRPLNNKEREAFKAFLLYPKDMYKLIYEYYRSWVYKNGLEMFEQMLELMKREEELITHLSGL